MHKIKILDKNLDLNDFKNKKKKSKKIIKIKDSLLELGLKTDLIEKVGNGYCLLGNYYKFLPFKNKNSIFI